MSQTAIPATYAASATSVMFGLTATEWQAIGVLGGLVLGILTYATSCYFKTQHLKLELKRQRKR